MLCVFVASETSGEVLSVLANHTDSLACKASYSCRHGIDLADAVVGRWLEDHWLLVRLGLVDEAFCTGDHHVTEIIGTGDDES